MPRDAYESVMPVACVTNEDEVVASKVPRASNLDRLILACRPEG